MGVRNLVVLAMWPLISTPRMSCAAAEHDSPVAPVSGLPLVSSPPPEPASPAPQSFPTFNLDALPAGSSLRAIPATDLALRRPASEGVMRVDVFINEQFIAQERVEFRSASRNTARPLPPAPCLERELLMRGGVDPTALDDRSPPDVQVTPPQPRQACIVVTALSPDASAAFDAAELRLDLSIPQVLMTRIARGSVDPAQWDPGITAAFVGYSFDMLSERTSEGRSLDTTLHYSAGLNTGLWHWRHDGILNASVQGALRHRPARWFVERPVPAWRMVLGVGETAGANPLLASVPLYGTTLGNDERMLPDSRRGYAPPIHGVATGPSTLVVSQHGRIVHEARLPAGAFVIDDLNPVANRGDLEVAITDRVGGMQRFSIPSASTPVMVRAGDTRFALSLGCHRTPRCGDLLLDAAARYGLMDRITVQAGLQWTRSFASLAAGFAANTHAGAFSFDASLSVGHVKKQPYTAPRTTGWDTAFAAQTTQARVFASQIRLGYATALASLHATFNAESSLRFGEGAIDLRGWFARGNLGAGLRDHRETQGGLTDVPVVTPIEWHGRGFFAQTLYRRFSWHASIALYLARAPCCARSMTGRLDHQLGAGTTLGPLSLSLNFAHSRSWRATGTQWHISLDLAMRPGRSSYAPVFSTQTNSNSSQGLSRSIGLAGTVPARLMKEHRLDYAFGSACKGSTASETVAYALSKPQRAALQCMEHITADFAYSGPHGAANASFARSGSMAFGTNGSVVLHRGGLTLGPALGDTIALVDTRHGQGLRLAGMPQVRADRRGYAIAPYLTPYRSNNIEVDQTNTPRGVRVVHSSRVVVPVAGAIARVELETKRVDTRRFRISMHDGRAPPFGAAVRTASGERVGTLGQGGRLVLPENSPGILYIASAPGHPACEIEVDEAFDTRDSNSATAAESATSDALVHLRCR